MHADIQALGNKLTTTAARLRGVCGVHERDMTTSIYRFVSQQRLEHSQPSIVRAERQVRIAQHEIEVEVFECDQAIGVNEPKGELVIKVTADVGNVFVQLGDQQALILAPIGTTSSATKAALRSAQFGKACSQPAGIVNQRAVRQAEQSQQAHIRANRRTAIGVSGQRVGQVKHQGDIPAARFVLEHAMLDLRGPAGTDAA